MMHLYGILFCRLGLCQNHFLVRLFFSILLTKVFSYIPSLPLTFHTVFLCCFVHRLQRPKGNQQGKRATPTSMDLPPTMFPCYVPYCEKKFSTRHVRDRHRKSCHPRVVIVSACGGSPFETPVLVLLMCPSLRCTFCMQVE